jgi:hypothetical protein
MSLKYKRKNTIAIFKKSHKIQNIVEGNKNIALNIHVSTFVIRK